jgi:transcriptional regulator GlxA family with amidase domain
VFLIFLPQFLGEDPLGPAPYLSPFALPPDRRFQGASLVLRERVLAIGRDMVREFEEQQPLWANLMRLHLLRLLTELVRVCADPQVLESGTHGRTKGTALARVIPAVKLVQTAPGRRVSGLDAAIACNLSPSRFYHLFRSAMGVSFGTFALRARLAFAAQHMLRTDQALRQVAEEAGFADASHLHRAFIRHYGCTPGEYRAETR